MKGVCCFPGVKKQTHPDPVILERVLPAERNHLRVCAVKENMLFILDIIISLTQKKREEKEKLRRQ
jgi:hypothetical protein